MSQAPLLLVLDHKVCNRLVRALPHTCTMCAGVRICTIWCVCTHAFMICVYVQSCFDLSRTRARACRGQHSAGTIVIDHNMSNNLFIPSTPAAGVPLVSGTRRCHRHPGAASRCHRFGARGPCVRRRANAHHKRGWLCCRHHHPQDRQTRTIHLASSATDTWQISIEAFICRP